MSSIGIVNQNSETEVIVTKRGHPFYGLRLGIDPRIAHRRDRQMQVILPDGSRMVISEEWTNLAEPSRKEGSCMRVRFSVLGLPAARFPSSFAAKNARAKITPLTSARTLLSSLNAAV